MNSKNRISTLCLIILSILTIAGCNYQESQSTDSINCTLEVADPYSYFLIDSILQHGLDREALYTLLGSVKPMSSLISFAFPIAITDNASNTSDEHETVMDRIRTIQKAVSYIQIPDIKIVESLGFASPPHSRHVILFNAVRISSLDSLLKAKENFFGQFGLVPGTDPNIVLNTIDSLDQDNRHRGYGYLYGYPDYAIDFFVETVKSSGRPVERNFFLIPTYTTTPVPRFVSYAYPKNAKPTKDVDSALYYRAINVLEQYKKIRPAYMNADSTVRAYELLIDLSSK